MRTAFEDRVVAAQRMMAGVHTEEDDRALRDDNDLSAYHEAVSRDRERLMAEYDRSLEMAEREVEAAQRRLRSAVRERWELMERHRRAVARGCRAMGQDQGPAERGGSSA